jgi:hypothetical protein
MTSQLLAELALSEGCACDEARIFPRSRLRRSPLGVDVRKLRVAAAMRAWKRCHAGLGFGGHGW